MRSARAFSDVFLPGLELRFVLVLHLMPLAHGGLPRRFLRAFRLAVDAHEPHQHAQPHEPPTTKASAIWLLASAAQAADWPGLAGAWGTLSGAGEACCLVTSLAEPRRGPLDFDITSRPAPPLSCWSVPGWVQQMNAAPTSSRIILGLAVENSSTVDWRIVAKSWGAAFDLLAASGLRLTGEDRSICVEQGARTG